MNMYDTLKRSIAECGMSHRKLALMSDTNRLCIDRFMNGRTAGMSLMQASKIADALGLSLVPESQVKRTRKG